MSTRAGRRERRRRMLWRWVPRLLTVVLFTVIGLALAVLFVLNVLEGHPPIAWLAPTLSLAGVALGWRFPYPALALLAGSPLVAVALGEDPTALWSVGVFAVMLLTLHGASGLALGLVTGAANFAAVAVFEGGVSFQNPPAMVAAGATLAAAAVGAGVRSQTAYQHELEGRARDALASRAAAIRHGVTEERLRIARDLHDSVGHHIAVVNMHLGAAEVQLPDGAEKSRDELHAARRAVQGVLAETQQILAVLRGGSGGEEAAPLAPQSVQALVARSREAGLSVDADLAALDGLVLPAPISAAVYRIVQESLTNAQRHGAGSLALEAAVADGAVVIRSTNLKADSRTTVGGRGLVGMRERAESVGGRLDYGDDGRLFWLQATLPTTPKARTA